MEFSRSHARAQVIKTVSVLVVVALLSLRGAESRRARIQQGGTLEYRAINCRSHSASLTDFGGVADGKTSNTKAFQAAIDKLSQYASDGGAQLYIPAGKWLTGSFSLTSHFTLYLDKDAVLLASQDMNEWPVLKPLPSYGRGRDAAAGRYTSLIFGTNLTDVVVTGDNGTIDGQGAFWWQNFHRGKLKYTRPYLIEVMFSDNVQISNLTLLNSPSWNVHPVYTIYLCKGSRSSLRLNLQTLMVSIQVSFVSYLVPKEKSHPSALALGCKPPSCYFSNPTAQIELSSDSCTNIRIEDCYIVSGDDCIAVKSGWDEYGIAFGWPTKQLVIRRLTCISPYSAAIALGSEMSGGIQDVRAEDIVAIQTESAVRIKTAIGRGAYVKDIYVKKMSLHTMKWVFLMSGNYKAHPDNKYDPNALPVIQGINYRDVVAENVTVAGRLEGISGDPFTGICMSNVTIGMASKAKKMSWRCSDVAGITSGVTPPPCDLLADQGPEKITPCDFPEDTLPIDMVEFKECSYRMGYL